MNYGTLLLDLERHRVVDLLPDRSDVTFARWLRAHREVHVISRDRGGGDLSVLDGLHLHQQRVSDELKVADAEAGKVNGSHPLVDARRN